MLRHLCFVVVMLVASPSWALNPCWTLPSPERIMSRSLDDQRQAMLREHPDQPLPIIPNQTMLDTATAAADKAKADRAACDAQFNK